MGSSSTFTVGLLKALNALLGRELDTLQLAKDAIYVEREIIKERVGCQDQMWAAFGGMARIDFSSEKLLPKSKEPIRFCNDQ